MTDEQLQDLLWEVAMSVLLRKEPILGPDTILALETLPQTKEALGYICAIARSEEGTVH